MAETDPEKSLWFKSVLYIHTFVLRLNIFFLSDVPLK